MEFNPDNSIVKLCLQGMNMEANGNLEEAGKLFLQAWNEATTDFEKYLAAHYRGRHATDVPAKLKWFETALQLALKIDDHATNSALRISALPLSTKFPPRRLPVTSLTGPPGDMPCSC